MTQWSLARPLLRRAMLVVLPIVLAGCVSLTPEQSTQLKKAQQFVDEVTDAYGVPRMKLIVDKTTGADGVVEYWPTTYWITIRPSALARGNVQLTLVKPLAWATLQRPLPSGSYTTKVTDEWEKRYEDDRRGVEIIVKFLGMSTRQAVDYYAEYLVAVSKRRFPSGDPDYRRFHPLLVPPPCDRLRGLWSHFAIADPVPTC